MHGSSVVIDSPEPALAWALDDPRRGFLAAFFELTGDTGVALSPFDVFYVAGLTRRGHAPVALARELASYGYVDYLGGVMQLTPRGRRCCHQLSMRRPAVGSEGR